MTTQTTRSHMVDAFAYAMKSWPPKPIDIFEDWYPWRIYRRWIRKRAIDKMANAFKPMLTAQKRKWFSYEN